MKTNPVRFASLTAHDGREPLIRVYQLCRPAIQFLTALVEASDGIGLVRTLDEQRGIVECWIMPDFEEEYDKVLQAVAEGWPIQALGREFE
jgi:hypothetical protein